MGRLASLAALLLLAPGCFVLDELDAGRALMEQHSPKKAEEKKPAAATRMASADTDQGLIDELQGWWKKKRREAEEASRPAPDPDDVPVRCRIGGRTHFVRKSDCALRGGQPL